MAKKLTKKQQEALSNVQELGGEVILSTEDEDNDLDPYDELCELDILDLINEDDENGTVTYVLKEDSVSEDTTTEVVEADDTPIAPADGEDLSAYPVPETKHFGYLDYCGYKDSGFRSHLKEDAEAHAEHLRNDDQRNSTVTQLRGESARMNRCAIYGVWAMDKGTAKKGRSGGGRGTGITRLYHDIKAQRHRPEVEKKIQELRAALDEAIAKEAASAK